MKFHIYVFTILIASSFLLIGGSFTGKVVSQSCCFGPDCQEEYLCPSAYLESSNPVNNLEQIFATVIGVMVLIGSIVMLNMQHGFKKHRHELK